MSNPYQNVPALPPSFFQNGNNGALAGFNMSQLAAMQAQQQANNQMQGQQGQGQGGFPNIGNMNNMGNMGNMGNLGMNQGDFGNAGMNVGNYGNMGNMGMNNANNMGNMGNLGNMGNAGGMGNNIGNMGNMGQNQQSNFGLQNFQQLQRQHQQSQNQNAGPSQTPQFNYGALANIPPSALSNIPLPPNLQAQLQQQQNQNQGQIGIGNTMNQQFPQQSLPQAGPSQSQQMQNQTRAQNQNQNNNFSAMHQTFQRLQNQESQKQDQQRLGLGVPSANGNGAGMGAVGANLGLSQQQQQQIFQQMQALSQRQTQRPSGQANPGAQGVQGGSGGQAGQMQQIQSGQMPGQGVNPHSQQQGLQMPNMQGNTGTGQAGQAGQASGSGDSEAGRRMALQNMLSLQLSTSVNAQAGQPNQSQPNQSGPTSLPPNMHQQQILSQLPSEASNLWSKIPQAFKETMLAKHNGNLAGAIGELLAQKNGMMGQQQFQGQQSNQAGQLPQGQNQNQNQNQGTPLMGQGQQARQPNPVGVNGLPQQQQQQQQQQPQQLQQGSRPSFSGTQGPGGGGMHQRMNSEQSMGGFQQQQQGQQGQVPGQNFDPKQFEALQLMKERQERQATLVTPNLQSNQALPSVSPQASLQQPHPPPLQNQDQQGPNQFRRTPQTGSAQLSQQFAYPQQQQQQQPQQQNQQGQQQQQGNRPQQSGPEHQQQMQQTAQNQTAEGANGARQTLAEQVRVLSDEQLQANAVQVMQRLGHASSPKDDPSRFQLLTLISEFKRRDLEVPQGVINAITVVMGNAASVQAILRCDWRSIQGFAQKSAIQAEQMTGQNQHLGNWLQQQQQQQKQQQQQQSGPGTQIPARQSSLSNHTGTQANPIEINTPQLISTPSIPPIPPPPYTPTSQNAQLSFQQMQQQQQQGGHTRQASMSGQQFQPPSTAQIQAQLQQQQQQQQQQVQLQALNQSQSSSQGQPQNQQVPGQGQTQNQNQNQNQNQGQGKAGGGPGSTNTGPGRPFPWSNIDFREENIPFDSTAFWNILRRTLKRADVVAPVIQGREVDLYRLFTLVHRNGGYARIDQNSDLWQLIGAHLGFGQSTNSDQPARAPPMIANELRNIYQQYLTEFEKMWYMKLYQYKQQRAGQQLQQQQQLAQQQAVQQQAQQVQQQVPVSQQPSVPPPSFPTSTGSATQPLPLTPQQQMQAIQAQQQQYQTLLQQTSSTSNVSLPPNLPPQFLEALARTNPASLDPQQKQYLENALRMANQSAGGNANASARTPSLSLGLPTPTPPAGALLPISGGVPGMHMTQNVPGGNSAAQAILAAQAQAQAQNYQQSFGNAQAMLNMANSLKGNPGLCYQFIQNKESMMRERFRTSCTINAWSLSVRQTDNVAKSFVDVPIADQAMFLDDLRSLAGLAKDAQEKMPKYMLVAAERDAATFRDVVGLIQLYMAVLITLHHAEQGRFTFTPEQLIKFREQLGTALTKTNQVYEEARAGPDGPAKLERLFMGLSRSSPRDVHPGALQPTNTNAALAANLPKGLRVEDLKPPPAKRAKGKAAKDVNGSPAAQTPEAKTPGAADSPAAASPRKPPTKRKRTATTDKLKDDAKFLKPEIIRSASAMAEPGQDSSLVSMPGASAATASTSYEIDVASHRGFFQSRQKLESGESDVWAALSSAVDDFNTTLDPGLLPQVPPTSIMANGNSSTGAVSGVNNEDELFRQWIDSAQLAEMPTPELYHPGILNEDDPDTSPESIKTVGSTTGIGSVPAAAVALSPGVEKKGMSVVNQSGQAGPVAAAGKTDNDSNEVGDKRMIATSPSSQAYNGSLFWDEYDFGIEVV